MVAGIPADTPVSPTNGLCSVEKGGKVVRVCVGVGGVHGIQQRGVLSWILQWVAFKLVLCHYRIL